MDHARWRNSFVPPAINRLSGSTLFHGLLTFDTASYEPQVIGDRSIVIFIQWHGIFARNKVRASIGEFNAKFLHATASSIMASRSFH